MAQKNFVVSFNASNDNTRSVLSGYNSEIMEIMIRINTCDNYCHAQNSKIAIINDFINTNKESIEHIIYIYSFELALTKYKERFNGLNSIINVLIKDLVIMIIDEIICIYEAHEVEINPIVDYNTINKCKVEREDSPTIENIDNGLQFNMDVRANYNTIIGNMISENSNY